MHTLTTLDRTTLPRAEVAAALRSEVTGSVVEPADAGYDEARRLWNGLVDRHPGLIVRCRTTADVQAVVRQAVARRLVLAVRGGGHNVAGSASCDGGVVVDLSEMNTVEVDPDRRRVRAEGGATWADVDAATARHGLATPGGVVSDTGIGGLTLGGGIGWLRRKHGLSADNLVAADVVTADGAVHRVDESTDPELLWGLRGGGGNFGVLTSLEFDGHPIGPEVYCAFVVYPADRTRQVLTAYRDYTGELPDAVSSFLVCGTVPEVEEFPEASWGEPFVMVVAVAAAEVGTGERLTRPMRRLGEPIVDMSGPMPFTEVQRLFDADYPTGLRYYWKSLYLPGLDDETFDLYERWAAARPTPLSTLDIWHLGGAMSRVGPEATAFGDRSAPYLLGVEANWQSPADDEANLAWTRDTVAAFAGASTGRQYLNFPGFLEGGQTTLRAAHGEANYRRLTALKRRLDPGNVFRLHQNIPPAGEG
jgi:FAD/FMN-containing dehydrogenase